MLDSSQYKESDGVYSGGKKIDRNRKNNKGKGILPWGQLVWIFPVFHPSRLLEPRGVGQF